MMKLLGLIGHAPGPLHNGPDIRLAADVHINADLYSQDHVAVFLDAADRLLNLSEA